ncbi:MAG: ion transporter [Lachnospiraceae bacterium]
MIQKKEALKKRIFEIIQIGNRDDKLSSIFDYFIVFVIFLNIFAVFYETFDSSVKYGDILYSIEAVTSVIFLIEYIIRLWTADYLYPDKGKLKSRVSFVISFYGIVDLLSFLPFFLPVSVITGAVAFRMLRVARVFHLFKINAQYDAFNVVIDVLKEKRQQLFSSIVLILIMMLSSSLLMYGLEHDAQPEVFENAFSGIWWSVSTLLTVGYGDIYPITLLGKIMGIVIAFLGVGMVAIPTGIISAGFVERYTKMKSLTEISFDGDMRFIMLFAEESHPWVGCKIKDIVLPPELVVVVVVRNGSDLVIPNGNTTIKMHDRIVLGALEFHDDIGIMLKEVSVTSKHIWADKKIRQLEVPEDTVIVSVFRDGKSIIPNGNTLIRPGDMVTLCEKKL